MTWLTNSCNTAIQLRSSAGQSNLHLATGPPAAAGDASTHPAHTSSSTVAAPLLTSALPCCCCIAVCHASSELEVSRLAQALRRITAPCNITAVDYSRSRARFYSGGWCLAHATVNVLQHNSNVAQAAGATPASCLQQLSRGSSCSCMHGVAWFYTQLQLLTLCCYAAAAAASDLDGSNLPSFLAAGRPGWSAVRWIVVDGVSGDVLQVHGWQAAGCVRAVAAADSEPNYSRQATTSLCTQV